MSTDKFYSPFQPSFKAEWWCRRIVCRSKPTIDDFNPTDPFTTLEPLHNLSHDVSELYITLADIPILRLWNCEKVGRVLPQNFEIKKALFFPLCLNSAIRKECEINHTRTGNWHRPETYSIEYLWYRNQYRADSFTTLGLQNPSHVFRNKFLWSPSDGEV